MAADDRKEAAVQGCEILFAVGKKGMGGQCALSGKKPAASDIAPAAGWRSGWDSNPRARADNLISSQARYDHFDTAPFEGDSLFGAGSAMANCPHWGCFCAAACKSLQAGPLRWSTGRHGFLIMTQFLPGCKRQAFPAPKNLRTFSAAAAYNGENKEKLQGERL